MPMTNTFIDDPTTFNSSTLGGYVLGERYFWTYTLSGNNYPWELRFVQFLDAVTYAAGQVVAPADVLMTKVSNDVDVSATSLRCAGVCLGVMTQNYYGFVLTHGYYPTVKTNGDDDIAANDTVIMVATDGVVDSIAKATTTGTLLLVGIATDADVDANNTVAVMVNSPLW